jgi:cytochrome c-type biogenesis protein CcmH/NrfF
VPSQSEARKQIESDIMCTCGCRVQMSNCPMGPSCHGLQELRPKLDALAAKGLNREQMRDAMVAEHGGQDILSAPIDEGFNRLAWLLPYAIGVAGAVGIVIAAKRWARHDATPATPDSAPVNAALKERLDDELRDLD